MSRRTRGKTRPGRLSRLDDWLLAAHRERLQAADSMLAVDLGVGERPDTSLELLSALRRLRPDATLIAVDHDPARVALARSAAPELDVREGSFELPLSAGERPTLIRCMNVLRGLPEAAHPGAIAAMMRALTPGGLLLEGSCDAHGAVLTAHVRVPDRAVRSGLLFSTDFSRGFAPILFRDWLPRDLRRRVRTGEPIHDALFGPWEAAWRAARAAGAGQPRAAFTEAARRLRLEGYPVEIARADQGDLFWAWPPG